MSSELGGEEHGGTDPAVGALVSRQSGSMNAVLRRGLCVRRGGIFRRRGLCSYRKGICDTTVLLQNIRLVVFDLDGTLVDSNPDIAVALDLALRSMGRQGVTVEQVTPSAHRPG